MSRQKKLATKKRKKKGHSERKSWRQKKKGHGKKIYICGKKEARHSKKKKPCSKRVISVEKVKFLLQKKKKKKKTGGGKKKKFLQRRRISHGKRNRSWQKKKKFAGENKMFLRQYIYNKFFVKFENL